MLRVLIEFSLKHRGVVIALACLAIAYGVYVTGHAKLDVFPDFVQPQVMVQTEAPGLSPEQVELLVTLPLETMLNGLGEMQSLRSESIEGLSIITAVFKEGSDLFIARQMLAEKLAASVGTLPASVNAPRMTPLTSSTMDLLKIGLVTDKLTPMELRAFADWTLKPRLLAVPGVAKCSAFGGEVRQLQVQVLPDRLATYGLGLSDVLRAARLSTGVAGAGFIETANQRITLQTEGQATTAEALQQVVVAHTNQLSVRLGDVARVVEGVEPKYGDCLIQGRWGVLLTMSSQYGANTLEVTRSLEAALDELKPLFEKQGIQVYRRLHRPATFIETALANMQHSLVLGGVLVAAVLFLLLGSVRTACISLIAIPLSLLTAVVVLNQLGVSLNTITLGGLVIALGEVVDDSIIDVENIFRRLRQNQQAAVPRPLIGIVLDASLEVRRAVVFATFIVALVFLPVLTLTGLQGSFFSPLALSYILATLASLLVALTVTPALALWLFHQGVRRTEEPWLQRQLKHGYRLVLQWTLRRPGILFVLVLAGIVFAATRLPFLGGDFLPEFREGHFVLQVFTTPGTSMPEMLRLGRRISDRLLADPRIDTVEQQIGRAELGEDPWSPNRSEFHVELKPVAGRNQARVADSIRETLGQFPGIQFEVLTFLGDRISETLTGETAPVVVSVFGEDLDVLDTKAAEVAGVLRSVSGAVDVKIKSPPGAPRQVIRLRPERLTQYGFSPVELLEALQTMFQGSIVAQVHRGNQTYNVSVILDPAQRAEPEGLGRLLLRSTGGTVLPLDQLVEIYPTTGRTSILHEGARRRQTVTCAASGRDTSSFVEEAQETVERKVNFPSGTYAEFSGAAQAKAEAQRELLLHSAVAAAGILLLLTVVFHQWRNLVLVLANIPFALVGGVMAAWLSKALLREDSALTMGSLVGFVTLFGITMRNSIMMISHFEHLVQSEGVTWGKEAVLRGASERLMPILMTASVTGLALLPLALGAGEAGREIEGPMAVVILGGLVTSTALNLVVLPCLALRFGRFQARQEAL
jgi:CzcA family heavy metal efflux pump